MSAAFEEGALEGWTVLLAEDEYLIALDVARMLERAGARVLGPVPKVAQALAILDREQRVDAAVLDVNLAGDTIYPLAEALARRAVPIVFATGYNPSAIRPDFARMTRCEKPIVADRLFAALYAARAAVPG